MLYPYVMSTCHFVCYKLLLFPAVRSLDARCRMRVAPNHSVLCVLCVSLSCRRHRRHERATERRVNRSCKQATQTNKQVGWWFAVRAPHTPRRRQSEHSENALFQQIIHCSTKRKLKKAREKNGKWKEKYAKTDIYLIWNSFSHVLAHYVRCRTQRDGGRESWRTIARVVRLRILFSFVWKKEMLYITIVIIGVSVPASPPSLLRWRWLINTVLCVVSALLCVS